MTRALILALTMLGLATLPARAAITIEILKPIIVAEIDKSTQRMKVSVNGEQLYSWKVSTGTRNYSTPVGEFAPYRMHTMWRSRQYDFTPMPHAVFFYEGVAVHGTSSVGRLGRPASHGCVRLHPANARKFFNLILKHGRARTQISVSGDLVFQGQEDPQETQEQQSVLAMNCASSRKVMAALVALCLLMPMPRMAMAETDNCPDKPVSQDAVIELIDADLKSLTAQQAKATRYLTLVNLLNACAQSADMDVYRHGIKKLLNSLSWMEKPVQVEAIDLHRAILRISLAELGWDNKTWERLLPVYPYGLQPGTPKSADIVAATGSPMPYLRGDWLAFAASQPPLYYSLLKMPRTIKALRTRLGSDGETSIRSFWARKSGYKQSLIAGRVRLTPEITYTDKEPERKGYSKEDFAPALTAFPLNDHVRQVPKLLANVSLFELPNGFRGYFFHSARGMRIDRSPLLPCGVCNLAGLVVNVNQSDTDESSKSGVQVAGIYPVSADAVETHLADHERWRQRLTAAGFDVALEAAGEREPVRALAERFSRHKIMLNDAAGELGVAPTALEKAMLEGGQKTTFIARVLVQHGMKRDKFKANFRIIADAIPGLKPMRKGVVGKYAGLGPSVRKLGWFGRRRDGFTVSMVSDKSSYNVGEEMHLSVQPQVSCNLTLVSVNANGSAVVIFPNRFHQDTFIDSDKILAVPDKRSPFKLRLNDKGKETVYGFCNARNRWSGVNHKFGEAPFTEIENFAEYLNRRAEHEGKRSSVTGFARHPFFGRSSITVEVK